jgi:hypothetical protein
MQGMADSTPPISGGCMCGKVRFEVSEPLLGAAYCHCKRCQRRTGTAFSVSALTTPGSFRVTEGEEHLGSYVPGDGWNKFFCRECGGQLYTQNPDEETLIAVRAGAVDGDIGVRPSLHQYVAYAAPWHEIPDDGLPRYDERMPTNVRDAVQDQ